MSGFLGLVAAPSLLGEKNFSPVWNPTVVGSAGAWWRADNVTLTSGKVSTWQDISGQGLNLAQGTAGNRPTQVSSVANGQPVVRFTAASSNFLISSTFATAAHPITYWVVAKLTSQAGFATIFNSAVAGPAIGDAIYASSATEAALYGSGLQFSATLNMTTAFITYIGICNGTSSILRTNGSQLASGTLTSTGGIIQMTVGALFNGLSQYADGDIAEIGFTKQVLSGNNLTNLENYLRIRYATW